MNPKLSICNLDIKNPWNTLGLTELLTFLKESGKFDIAYHDEKISTGKAERSTLIYYNDKRIFVDFWDYAMPTYTEPIFNAKLDLIIKLQHPLMTPESFEAKCLSKNVFPNSTKEQRLVFFNKIIPWTFFCSRMMKPYIGKEDTIAPLPIERTAFFCGKSWKCRGYMVNKLRSEGIDILDSDQGFSMASKGKFSPGKVLTDEQYLRHMQTSKYGLVLHGRGSFMSEAKNRREIDYMMLKKPLLLNYKPNYYNPMVEGKHYIYMNENISFKDLDKVYNIEEIAQNGYKWYKDNATPEGVVNTFLQIMNERGLNEKEKQKS